MNIVRLVADLLHLLSFIIIIAKLLRTRSCRGVSCKTQEVYLVVFCFRYLDLFMYFVSLYNTVMKILFIGATIFIIYLMRAKNPICTTYDREKNDKFPHYYLFPVALVLTFLVHTEWKIWEFIWSYSLWLESLAIFPQITILTDENGVEPFTAHYIASLGTYRFFYIINWIYRYFVEGYLCWTSIFSGIVQTLLYLDFFYLYIKNIKIQLSTDLPTKMDANIKEDTN